MEYTTIGIDVSKNFLDVCFLPHNKSIRIPNDTDGYNKLAEYLGGCKSVKICMESTGCYHQNVQKHFEQAGFAVRVANPKHVRDFAKSCGKLAKTDKIDAYMIAKFGEFQELCDKSPKSPRQEQLRVLVLRRRQAVKMRKMEKTHAEKFKVSGDKNMLRMISACIAAYEHQISEIDLLIKGLLAACPDLRKIYDTMMGVCGVGHATACELMAEMPELGTLSPREAAALAGVAPMNCDSGGRRGQRHIIGGRFNVRGALYMACVSGIRFNPVLRAYYHHLYFECKKPFKVAMVACMRKLLLHLNRLCDQKKNITIYA